MNYPVQRRELLKLAAYSTAAYALRPLGAAANPPRPILDAHIHLFDPTRPGGVVWPEISDTVLYKPALPGRYEKLAKPFGIIGAIAVEASPLATDNDWLLRVAAAHPIIVGVIGDLVPGDPTYLRDLDRLHRDPLFLGFRYGNLWGRNLATDLQKTGFLDGLRALAEANLVLESANPDAALIAALVQVGDRVPNLRIVIDHLPHAALPTEKPALETYGANLSRLAQNPNVFVKLSEIPTFDNGSLITDPEFYRRNLDAIWDLFGGNRTLFGSDWPNSDHIAGYADTVNIVRAYMSAKGDAANHKFFYRNSIAAYHWKSRRANQAA